jgi:hypothetical protein
MNKLRKGEALMLRTCNPDGTSHNGFQWPKSGLVKCPDWSAVPKCGNGLHGLLWGEGDGFMLNWKPGAVWLVVRIKESEIVHINGKIKVPKGFVEFFGCRADAVSLLQKYAPAGKTIIGGTATAGDGGTATAGYRGTATAGDRGTATAGDRGTATAGDEGTATAGDEGTAIAGGRGTATAGDRGTATAGDEGTATAGYRGTAIAGDGGTATAGVRGTATAGDRGTATAGVGGTATAGDGGCISILYCIGSSPKLLRAVFKVGENGLEPNQPYQVNGKGEPLKVSER